MRPIAEPAVSAPQAFSDEAALATRLLLTILAALALANCSTTIDTRPLVALETPKGVIVMAIETEAAPITAENFLAYVDGGLFEGAEFYRAVTPDNDPNPAAITVLQGGLNSNDDPLPPIRHEPTVITRLTHSDGAVSMARLEPGTAGSEFFISIGDNPELDFGGARNPDGHGFAVFGQVIQGMDVVHAIHAAPRGLPTEDDYFPGQLLDPPVRILGVNRISH
ncbi:MAG: peptidylprolyl isomerase [Pseudomonadota bacterium]